MIRETRLLLVVYALELAWWLVPKDTFAANTLANAIGLLAQQEKIDQYFKTLRSEPKP